MAWTASIGAVNIIGPDVTVRVDYTNGLRTFSQTYVSPNETDFPVTVQNVLNKAQSVDDFVSGIAMGTYTPPPIPVQTIPTLTPVAAPITNQALQSEISSEVLADEPNATIASKIIDKIKVLFS